MPEAAKLLHVTERSVYAWRSGRHAVPWWAIKLLRVERGTEIGCRNWEGWHFHSGKLWSPEGYGFTPADSSYWALLCRKAATWGQLYERVAELEDWLRAWEAERAGGEAGAPGGDTAAPT
ncbi:MAG: DUF3653 domain-containing protein, partial [Xenophilus sp.]